ncbi:hypothetical protein BA065_01705 [Nanoarchaeota archaeon NZ13-N]|uniref:Uncharacterized protein n=1 Tax=Candidatus Nanoclepta minutus TaxID=1940235 RepID=A0A397WN26_9ARCH|nr:MAG: hypothetical protein BA065_01705 [Nanoarchaeota archaeon NZ13-N]RIB35470.1 MAG: hypothetical protein BXU00_01755 [Candidatus Nanoclepta minutus]
MKRFWLLIIILAIIIVSPSIFVYNNFKETGPLNRYCNDIGCVYTKYKIGDLKDIPINSNGNLSYLRDFNITFIFIDPVLLNSQLSGNFSVSYLNLVIALNNFAIYSNKSLRTIGVCTKIGEECNYYTNNSLDEYFWLFYKNETYLINGTKVLRIYIVNSTENEIEIDRNFIFLKGDEKGITRVLDKFLLYWYGIIDS